MRFDPRLVPISEALGVVGKRFQHGERFLTELVDEYGDRILPIGYAAPGIFETSWQPVWNYGRYPINL